MLWYLSPFQLYQEEHTLRCFFWRQGILENYIICLKLRLTFPSNAGFDLFSPPLLLITLLKGWKWENSVLRKVSNDRTAFEIVLYLNPQWVDCWLQSRNPRWPITMQSFLLVFTHRTRKCKRVSHQTTIVHKKLRFCFQSILAFFFSFRRLALVYWTL